MTLSNLGPAKRAYCLISLGRATTDLTTGAKSYIQAVSRNLYWILKQKLLYLKMLCIILDRSILSPTDLLLHARRLARVGRDLEFPIPKTARIQPRIRAMPESHRIGHAGHTCNLVCSDDCAVSRASNISDAMIRECEIPHYLGGYVNACPFAVGWRAILLI